MSNDKKLDKNDVFYPAKSTDDSIWDGGSRPGPDLSGGKIAIRRVHDGDESRADPPSQDLPDPRCRDRVKCRKRDHAGMSNDKKLDKNDVFYPAKSTDDSIWDGGSRPGPDLSGGKIAITRVNDGDESRAVREGRHAEF